ncbi:MAG: phytoene desaturase family protein [Schleiferiaceae bacterium]|jgi:phytoene desaturase|nr:phytoene desaturase family protein [Schleiferiaceae bacterium]MDR9441980.1 phytoene desaturase family protein [Schleiferiaceae bacterium]
MNKKVLVIGSGFAGLSAATALADKGYQVQILEKNDQPGGRARAFSAEGFTFDMGPSWYWMPDVFERYFQTYGKSVADYYSLERLDPSYRVYFGAQDYLDIPAGLERCVDLFESIEPGSGLKLRKFMEASAYKYEVGIKDLVYRPGRSLLEFADWRIAKGLIQLDLLKSIRSYVHQHFQNPRLRQLMEFPILFLGGTPKNTPALYSLMNYADMELGTWFPKGGMVKIVEGMVALAKEKGVEIVTNSPVRNLKVATGGLITGVECDDATYTADIVVAGADYHHVEQHLLPADYRQYSPQYWEKRDMAPSSLLYYLGVSRQVKGLLHHTLCFDESFDEHASQLYDQPQWPKKPLFYVSATSKTDPSAAPAGKENLFLLIPTAPGLEDTDAVKKEYLELLLARIKKLTGEDLEHSIQYQRSFATSDFISDYNSFKGNAYGLANTLRQTAILKPSLKSKKVTNLYYTGQLTVPGPGVPPSLISGQVVADEIEKDYAKALAV